MASNKKLIKSIVAHLVRSSGKFIWSAALFGFISLLSANTFASSFFILEQSPAHLGKAFSGTASEVVDASNVFFNPASIIELDNPTLTLGGNIIFTQATFNNKNSNTNGVAGKTDEIGYIPNIYYVHPVSERLSLGFGVNAPFGLASKYDDEWSGRYLATHSELQVVNINAVAAYALTDTFAADVSVYYAPTNQTHFGLVWRQGGEFDLTGDATFSLNSLCSPGAGLPTGAPPAPTTGTVCAASLNAVAGDAQAHLHLPDTVTLSGSYQLNDAWWIHGDIAWTEWSNIQNVDVINRNNNLTINTLELQYDDTMRYALGFTHQSNLPWTWRFGIAIDEAPQKDPMLTNPRIPDQDRIWFSAGFNYEFSPNTSIDLAYSHIKVDEATINNIDTQTGHRVEGSFDADVNIVGIQANFRF